MAIDQSIENLEIMVIGSILNEPASLDNAMSKLDPKDFSNNQLGIIFSVACALKREGKTVDANSVITYLDAHEELQFSNYSQTINNINRQFTVSVDIDDKIDTIKEQAIKRNLDRFASTIFDTKIDHISFNDQIHEIERNFMSIIGAKKSAKFKNMAEVSETYQQRIQVVMNSKSELLGVTSGYQDIDRVLNGFQDGNLMILAARPGVGKTALALNFLINAADSIVQKNEKSENGKKDVVVMFSLEMGADQLFSRMVGIKGSLPVKLSRIKNYSNLEWRSFNETISSIEELPILIDDSSDLSILDVQSRLKQISNDYNIKLVVLDYLQLLKGPKGATQNNRQQEVAFISRTLKGIARDKDINAPIIAIAQLSRAIEQRAGVKGNARPQLSDLRESGAIEQDADIVTFLQYKQNEVLEGSEEEPVIQQDQTQNTNSVIVEFIIAKHRNGEIANINLIFDKTSSSFLPMPSDNNQNNINH